MLLDMINTCVSAPWHLHTIDQEAPVTAPLAGDEEGVDAVGGHLIDAVILAVVKSGGVARAASLH